MVATVSCIKFLYVFKTGPSRARKRAATTGRAACPPLRFATFWARPLAWRARANRVPVEDSRTRHQRSTPCRCTTRRNGRLPTVAGRSAARLTVGSRIAPLAIMEGTVRPARVKGASGVAPGSRPLTRTAPNLRSAAIGAMREDCPRA